MSRGLNIGATVAFFSVTVIALLLLISYQRGYKAAKDSYRIYRRRRCFTFFVADDIRGIEPAYHEKIFIIFQKLHERDKVESRGWIGN